jgi:signal transduction histidine kinase
MKPDPQPSITVDADVLEPVKQLLEGSVDAAIILDSERRILYYNRAYEVSCPLRGRILAKKVRSGAHCYDIFPLEICAQACIGCKAQDAGRSLRVDEVRAVRADGEEMTFIVNAVPLAGKYIIETYRDVTGLVRIQRRLKVLLQRERRAKENLEETVIERTRELKQAQAQLVHQEKMSSLGSLVAGIAHELNNPINFVYGNVDFLRQYMEDLLRVVRTVDELEVLAPETREALDSLKAEIEYDFLVEDAGKLIQSIRSGAERTAGIVRDLKSFSHTGGDELQEVDVVAGIETTLNLIAPLIKNRVTVERTYDDDLPMLIANGGHVNQVFMNILTNAAQAIDGEGTIRVQVTTEEDGRWLKVVITDSGPGIGADDIRRIYEPFFTTKEVGEGTGLGLWICESIVRAHGGTMTCASEAGAGASFTVRLPVKAPDSARRGFIA